MFHNPEYNSHMLFDLFFLLINHISILPAKFLNQYGQGNNLLSGLYPQTNFRSQLSRGLQLMSFLPVNHVIESPPRSHPLLWSKYSQMQFSGARWLQEAFYLPADEKKLLLLLLSPRTEWQQRLLPILDLTLGKLHFPTPPKEILVALFIHVVLLPYEEAGGEREKPTLIFAQTNPGQSQNK